MYKFYSRFQKEGVVLKTKVALIKDITKDIKYIEEAAEIIKAGGTVAFPTETVYGLGANALDESAVEKIFIAKGRPQDNPLIVHVCDKDISRFVKNIPEVAKQIIEKFWPGPITLILEKKDIIPSVTSAGLNTIGIRMPDNPIALKLIEISQCPIAAPSANISGRPSPTDVERCMEDLDGRVDYILGGSKSDVGLESTILDCTVNPPCILRPGGITLEMLREIDKKIYIDPAIMEKPSESLKPKAPGMKYKHYAPNAEVIIIEGNKEKTIEIINEMVQNDIEKGLRVGVMCTDETRDFYKADAVISLGSREKLEDVAHNLFGTLRTLDDMKLDRVFSEGFDEKNVGIAVMNRLRKAAGFNIIKV